MRGAKRSITTMVVPVLPPTVTILLILLLTLCQAECPIECFCDEVTICSGDKQLVRFPTLATVDRRITRLELHDFLIEHLDAPTFLRLISNNITELRLTNNPQLTSMDNNTFSLPPAQTTDVESGSPATTGKTILSERGTIEEEVEEDGGGEDERESTTTAAVVTKNSSPLSLVFNLRTLDLSGNRLKYFVGGGRLKRLRLLDLSANGLQQVYCLDALTSLESLNLRDNQLERLDRSLFQNLVHLQYINLDSNKIVRLDPTTFSNLPSLAHLILSSNPIENLLAGFFWNSRVQYVDVSRVGLTRIPASLTTSVRDFRCANNNLTTIRQSDFESYPNVGLLVLDENSIETVEDDAFGRLDFLSRLWMNGNRLRRIPQNLPPSLRSLQLEDNRISSLNTTDFKNLINLEELNLNGNRLSSVPSFMFSELVNLRSLDLRSNLVDTLERNSFANLIKLETLDVSGNPIKVIVNGVFKDLVKLSLLQLSRLEEPSLEFDPSSFYPLVNLQVLELDDSPYLAQTILLGSGGNNNNDELGSNRNDGSTNSGLSYFMSLAELNLERCNLEDLQMVSAAITDSPLVDTLRVVKLSGNPWQCSCPPETLRHFITLYKRQIILDANQMTCAQPKGIKVVSAALKAAAKISTQNHGRVQQQQQHTYHTHSQPTDNGTKATPTSSSVAMPLPSETSHRKQPPSFMTSQSPVSTTTSTAPPTSARRTTISTPPTPRTASKSFSPTKSAAVVVTGTKTDAPSSVEELEITISEKPTQSYFEDHTTQEGTRRKTRRRTTTTPSISNKSEVNRGKLSSSSSSSSSSPSSQRRQASMERNGDEIQDRDEENLEQERGRMRETKSKTNDDNAIIDEHSNPESFQHVSQAQGRRRGGEEEKRRQEPQAGLLLRHAATPAGSIDGFPAFHHHASDPATPKSHNSSDTTTTTAVATSTTSKDNPNPSYLKSYNSDGGGNSGGTESSNLLLDEEDNGKTVIFKTLATLAAACLVSILFLLLLSVTVFRMPAWKFKVSCSPISTALRKWDKKTTEECDYQYYYSSSSSSCSSSFANSNNASYQNLNPPTITTTTTTHRGPTGRSYTRLGDQDTVELSGITNRLYFENEDIYHIT